MPPRPAKRGHESSSSLRCRSLQMPLAAIAARCNCRSLQLPLAADAAHVVCASPTLMAAPTAPPQARIRPDHQQESGPDRRWQGGAVLTAPHHSTTSQNHVTAPYHSTMSQHHITAPYRMIISQHHITAARPHHHSQHHITAPYHSTTSQHHHSTISQHDHSTISQHLSLLALPPPLALTASSSSSHLTLPAPLTSHCLLLGGTVCGVREGCGRWWSV
jgi:hypothetical protein